MKVVVSGSPLAESYLSQLEDLTGNDRETLAKEALLRGARDYLDELLHDDEPMTVARVEELLTPCLDVQDPVELNAIAKRLFSWGEVLIFMAEHKGQHDL